MRTTDLGLSFRQVVAVLQAMNGISAARSSAFESRVKQWQKMGFPEGVNVGRGVKVSYTATQLLKLIYLVELLRAGLTPDRAIQTVTKCWPDIRNGLTETLLSLQQREQVKAYSSFYVNGLSRLIEPDADEIKVACDTLTDVGIANATFRPKNIEPSEQEAYEKFAWETKTALSLTILIEINSLFYRLWGAMKALDIPLAAIAGEAGQWIHENAKANDHGSAKLHDEPQMAQLKWEDVASLAAEMIGMEPGDGDDQKA